MKGGLLASHATTRQRKTDSAASLIRCRKGVSFPPNRAAQSPRFLFAQGRGLFFGLVPVPALEEAPKEEAGVEGAHAEGDNHHDVHGHSAALSRASLRFRRALPCSRPDGTTVKCIQGDLRLK